MLKAVAFQSFALSGGWDIHAFAILGNGTTGDFDSLSGEKLDNHVIREDIVRLFFISQLFDAVFNCRDGGCFITGISAGSG